jgi:hypothetical protein
MPNFFSGIEQEDIAIRQYAGKSPMFFRNFQLMAGVYTADLAVCKSLVPNSRYHVLQILPGKALIGIHCMEYLDSDVGPYNEVSISIGIAPKQTLFSPVNILKSALTQNFHAYIVQLPVTTEVAYFGGVDYFNYPKFVAGIDFEERDGCRICTLSEPDSGKMIMTFEGKKISTKKTDPAKKSSQIMTLNSYPVMNGGTMHACMCVNMIEKAESFLSADGKLLLGEGGFAGMLKKLNPGRQINYLYAPKCESVMYLPEPTETAV